MMHSTIAEASRTFPAIVLTGPRQSGKTTLLRAGWGHSHCYLSLENPDTRARALNDPIAFLRDNPPPAILDEIQYAPQLLPYIKSAIDADRRPGQWLLTGSQSFPLMAGVGESLAGRTAVLNLLPLAAEEMLACDTVSSIPAMLAPASSGTVAPARPVPTGAWLLRGAYPELWANPEVNRDLWCASYIQTYLERDVRQLVNVGDLNAFDRFLRLAAARTGQILNYSDLARDAGISQPTAKQWISVLEASGLVYLLQPYHNNYGKRLIKSAKLYWLDTGLATFLLGLHHQEPLVAGPSYGPLLESVVVAEWVKRFRNRGLPPPLYYWRSRDGVEIDLLVDYEGRLHPFEIKASSTLTPRHADGLAKWLSLSRHQATEPRILADIETPMTLTPAIRAYPWWWV